MDQSCSQRSFRLKALQKVASYFLKTYSSPLGGGYFLSTEVEKRPLVLYYNAIAPLCKSQIESGLFHVVNELNRDKNKQIERLLTK